MNRGGLLSKKQSIETLAVHAGREIDSATGSLVAPIHMSTTFERDSDGGHSKGRWFFSSASGVKAKQIGGVCGVPVQNVTMARVSVAAIRISEIYLLLAIAL